MAVGTASEQSHQRHMRGFIYLLQTQKLTEKGLNFQKKL